MRPALGCRLLLAVLLTSIPVCVLAQTHTDKAGNECAKHPNTLRAMRDCYHALLVFAPSMDDPQLREQFNQIQPYGAELIQRDMLYVPIVPEGHNQPVPVSILPTASLGEDELAALRHHFKVESSEFMVILVGKDGQEKLSSRSPLPMSRLRPVIDSTPIPAAR